MAQLFLANGSSDATAPERPESERTQYSDWAPPAALALLLLETLVANRLVR